MSWKEKIPCNMKKKKHLQPDRKNWNRVIMLSLNARLKIPIVDQITVVSVFPDFLYPNILDTLSNIFSGSSKRIKISMLMHLQR